MNNFIFTVTNILLPIFIHLQGNANSGMHPTISLLMSLFFIQLGNAAAIEEPLFRGFLWGFLKSHHWNEYLIWLFQAALFSLGHIYYFGVNNFSFFVIVPFSALLFGLCAWRSRSIGTSMVVHGFYNSVIDVVSHMAWH
jgi:membrane protease YdiL (CAAX protease family)